MQECLLQKKTAVCINYYVRMSRLFGRTVRCESAFFTEMFMDLIFEEADPQPGFIYRVEEADPQPGFIYRVADPQPEFIYLAEEANPQPGFIYLAEEADPQPGFIYRVAKFGDREAPKFPTSR